jgi:hypothetical protein
MKGIVAVAGFGAAMAALNYVLRRREREGAFDPQSPSSAARPGLRRLFDYGGRGFNRDGIRQVPPER